MLAISAIPYMRTELTYEQEGDRRLTEWAKWTRGDDANLSYPRIEPYTKLVTPTDGGPTGPMPDEVAETDRAVCALKNRERSVLWRAIRQNYLRSDAITVSMQVCSTSRAGYYRLVKRAQRRIMDLIRDNRAAHNRGTVTLLTARI